MTTWLRSRRLVSLEHSVSSSMLLRAAALAVVVVALAVAAMQSRNTDDQSDASPTVATAADPLSADLARCRTVTPEQFAVDDTCRRVWAENRRRFFAPSSSRPSSASANPVAATPIKLQDRIQPLSSPFEPPEAR